MFYCRYAGNPGGPHYERWREEFGRRWLAADFQPVGRDYIANEFRATEHSFLAVCTMRGTPVQISRRDDVAERARGSLYFIIASGTPLQIAQRGRSSDLRVGEMALMSADEPATITQIMQGSRWSIRLPRNVLKDMWKNFDDKIARPVTADRGLPKLLLQQIDTAHRFGPRLAASVNHAMAQHILDLVGLCLGVDKDATHLATHRGRAAARLDAIKADLVRDIARSQLGLAAVAARHGLSARYVQHLFERAGTSFTSFVLEQRLRLAYRLLRDPSHHWRKVSDIACAAGFSDISYFNRAFKARFGATPRDVRATAVHEHCGVEPMPEADEELPEPLQVIAGIS